VLRVTRPAVPSFRLAPLAAFALALLLAGCGLKGPLEPPPSATPQQAELNGEAPQAQPQPSSAHPDRQPLRKSIFLDWLLD
jgi:predicted small lipoprotein YifL